MRPEKQAMVAEIAEGLAGKKFVLLADHQGMKVSETAELRARLRTLEARYRVVKNHLATRAATDRGWAAVTPLLQGPTALITGTGDVSQVARAVKEHLVGKTRPVIKGGLLGTEVLTAAEVMALADLPPREVLLGQLVGAVAGPMRGLVGVLSQKLSSLVQVLKAVEEKKRQTA